MLPNSLARLGQREVNKTPEYFEVPLDMMSSCDVSTATVHVSTMYFGVVMPTIISFIYISARRPPSHDLQSRIASGHIRQGHNSAMITRLFSVSPHSPHIPLPMPSVSNSSPTNVYLSYSILQCLLALPLSLPTYCNITITKPPATRPDHLSTQKPALREPASSTPVGHPTGHTGFNPASTHSQNS